MCSGGNARHYNDVYHLVRLWKSDSNEAAYKCFMFHSASELGISARLCVCVCQTSVQLLHDFSAADHGLLYYVEVHARTSPIALAYPLYESSFWASKEAHEACLRLYCLRNAFLLVQY